MQEEKLGPETRETGNTRSRRRSRKLTTHAFQTQTFSSLRAKSFCNVLLLSSPCPVWDRREPPSLRKSPGTRASELQASRLWVCRHAGTRTSFAERARARDSGRSDEVS